MPGRAERRDFTPSRSGCAGSATYLGPPLLPYVSGWVRFPNGGRIRRSVRNDENVSENIRAKQVLNSRRDVIRGSCGGQFEFPPGGSALNFPFPCGRWAVGREARPAGAVTHLTGIRRNRTITTPPRNGQVRRRIPITTPPAKRTNDCFPRVWGKWRQVSHTWMNSLSTTRQQPLSTREFDPVLPCANAAPITRCGSGARRPAGPVRDAYGLPRFDTCRYGVITGSGNPFISIKWCK